MYSVKQSWTKLEVCRPTSYKKESNSTINHVGELESGTLLQLDLERTAALRDTLFGNFMRDLELEDPGKACPDS